MKTHLTSLLILACLLGRTAQAQTIYNFSIGEIFAASQGSGTGIRLPDGTIVQAQFVKTTMAGGTDPSMGDDMFKTGNGATVGSVVDWLGGNFNNNPPGPASTTDGNTLAGYVGSTKAVKFTTIQADNAVGIENGFTKEFAGSVGVRLYFNRPTNVSNFLFVDIDGKKQSGNNEPLRENKEWATAFAYREGTYVPLTLARSLDQNGNNNSNLATQTVAIDNNHGWYKMIKDKLGKPAADNFPPSFTNAMAHVTTDAGSGDDDPDVLANQFLATTQNENATVTDFFVLFGIAGNIDSPTTNFARSGMSPLALKIEADFGDAPSSYKTLYDDNGPSHGIDTRLYLGTGVVSENDGKPHNLADGESNKSLDGITTTLTTISRNVTVASYSVTTTFKNTTGQTAHFVAWLDKDGDGDFQQSEASTFDSGPGVTNGTATFTWTNFLIDKAKTYLRIRVTTEARIDQSDWKGAFIDGEVEDYRIEVGALPVTLVSLDAKPSEKNITLNWKTANEKDFSHFDILKSADAKEFKSVGAIDGSGNGFYNFTDNTPLEGNNYYRLKMVDADGSFALSRVVKANFEANKTFLIAENPTKGGTFNVITNAMHPVFELFTISGSSIEAIHSNSVGTNTYTIKVKRPAAGLYVLKMTENGKTLTKKIIIP